MRGSVPQAKRPTAEMLLQMPLVTRNVEREEETTRKWLLQLGEPNGKPAGAQEPLIFMHWNSNPLLPPPTPLGSTSEGTWLPATSTDVAGARQEETAPALNQENETDLSRVPLQFLSQSNLESFDAEIEALKKKPKNS